MKKQRNLLIILAVFLVLMIGAYALYTGLLNDHGPSNLIGTPGGQNTAETAPSADTETSDNTDTEGTPPEEAKEEVYPAPDFTVFDHDGNEVKLSDFVGKPVVLNFWASWCGPCKLEMPEFEAAYTEHGSDIAFMMVNLTDGDRETVESAYSFISESGYTFPVYYDKLSQGAFAYSVSGIPATYFIDKDGNLAAYAISALDDETLALGISMILPDTSGAESSEAAE